MMWKCEYDVQKGLKLKHERNISFDDVMFAMEHGGLLDIVPNPNQQKYPHQEAYIVEVNGYVYVVPYVTKEDGTTFLKTIYPSRKWTKRYLGGSDAEN